ncbi:MAG: hypothetical protein Q4F60_01200 [Candidatus Saccharibacteria bacterium]|nr:hypothetical protein [Candidatus Saccharibacteria bacterium]
MTNRIFLLFSLFLTVLLLLVMNFTAPDTLGPLGVLAFFIVLYLVFFGVFVWVVDVFFRIRGKRGRKIVKFYAGVLAFAPVIFLLLKPFVGFSIWAVFLVVCFEFLGCFLVYKAADK